MHRARRFSALSGPAALGRIALPALLCAIVPLAAAPAVAADTRTHCDVAFDLGALPADTLLGFLDFTVDYQRPKIFPLDPQNHLHCEGLPAGAAAAASNQFLASSTGRLTIAFVSEQGVAGQTPLLRCDVYAAGSSVPVAGDFPVLTLVEARDAQGQPLDPLPTVSVGNIRCGDAVTTTTSTTTTSTQAPSSTTTTTLAPETCGVRFRLDSGDEYRSLLLRVDFSDAGGNLPLPAANSCVSLAGAGLDASWDPSTRSLRLQLVSVQTLDGPLDLVRCDFVPTRFLATPSAFGVEVLAARDSNGAPVAGLPSVSASAVLCPSLSTTTTSTTLATTTTSLPPALCGDADNDGKLEASDALAALRTAVGLLSLCSPTRCDVDGSGSITASDALRILKAAVGSESGLSCPV